MELLLLGPTVPKVSVLLIKVRRGNLEFPLWLSRVTSQSRIQEDAGSIPGLALRLKDPPLPGAARPRLGSGGSRGAWPAAAAPTGSLAWKLPYTEGVALKKKKRERKPKETPRAPGRSHNQPST